MESDSAEHSRTQPTLVSMRPRSNVDRSTLKMGLLRLRMTHAIHLAISGMPIEILSLLQMDHGLSNRAVVELGCGVERHRLASPDFLPCPGRAAYIYSYGSLTQILPVQEPVEKRSQWMISTVPLQNGRKKVQTMAKPLTHMIMTRTRCMFVSMDHCSLKNICHRRIQVSTSSSSKV